MGELIDFSSKQRIEKQTEDEDKEIREQLQEEALKPMEEWSSEDWKAFFATLQSFADKHDLDFWDVFASFMHSILS